MLTYFKTLFNKIGIDWAIAYTLLARAIQTVGGLVVVVFIVRFLSKDEQGYYYTFGSLLGIQVFFELGLSSIITQYVAHEIAHLTWKDKYHTEGDIYYQSRLSSLLHFCVKWFLVLSVFFFIALYIAGTYFFSKFNAELNISWKGPWVILSITTCCYLVYDPLLAFLEGLGKVKEVARMRLAQQVTYLLCVIGFLLSGFKLYSSALASILSFVCAFLMIFISNNSKTLIHLWNIKGEWKINYRKEIFPFQWKIALSWISGYFIFQLFNPITFATDGPVAAGQMGLSLAALGGITSVSMSWINTKIPSFSSLIARKEYQELDSSFFKTLFQSTLISGLCLLVLFIVVGVLQKNDIPIGKRFLPIWALVFLGSTTFLNHIIFSLAAYLRCHKEEPLLIYSFVLGIVCCISIFIFGKLFGLYGVSVSYAIITLFISFPWVLYIFNVKRKLWHQIQT